MHTSANAPRSSRPIVTLIASMALLVLPSCASRGLVVRDVSAAFAAFAARTGAMAPDARLAAFDREVTPSFPAFYRWKLDALRATPRGAATVLDEHVRRHPALRERYERVRASLGSELARHGRSFRAAFPDFEPDIEVWVLHSLGELDGGIREIGGREYFLLGVDGIARFHAFEDQGPFFHHELFHLYHRGYFEPGDELWGALWAEGLAVHVSRSLNPRASEAELLLDVPTGLRADCEANRAAIVAFARERLRSTRGDDYATLFLMRSERPDVPRRSGYWLGEQVVRSLARTRSMHELVRWRGEGLRSAIEATLGELAQAPQTDR